MRTTPSSTISSSGYVSLPHTPSRAHRVQTQGDAWFKPSEENISAGVCIRVEPGHFRVFPYENPFLAPFEAAIRTLNPVVAVKVRSAAVHAALATVSVLFVLVCCRD